ncbi:hypothetical protein B0T10DRAFT_577225 [Thelonectria olida]|uniref:NAD-dependent epimerase/dehydratase domain-containing protein n=1 Tax=Thelonectria olida TaxID=1576542 RepID=A0A9P8W1Q6_9HYPO|nr:hypothetical protein B0T10DRAFT_577225 [Thelonectria olida]
MVNIFLTGGTGYIGGDALYSLLRAHPELQITCLARNSDKGALLSNAYPSVRLVYGDLDDFNLLAAEASKADIICHLASCEHVGAAKAVAEGLSGKSPEKTGYLIHLSGSDILCGDEIEASRYGTKSDKIYDDWEGIDELTSPKHNAPHADVDSVVLGLGARTGRTAIVCPPTIYGPGRGPGNKRSIQIPELAMYALKRGAAPYVEAGENIWNTVHLHDLSNLFLKLVEDAVKVGGAATWGVNGYYFVESGHVAWADAARMVAGEARKQGYLKQAKVESLSHEDADQVWPYASLFWGTNSRCKAARARHLLGWSPVGPSLCEEISATVANEATILGLNKS